MKAESEFKIYTASLQARRRERQGKKSKGERGSVSVVGKMDGACQVGFNSTICSSERRFLMLISACLYWICIGQV